MKGIRIIIRSTLIAVLVDGVIMEILSVTQKYYSFMYVFVMVIANIILPVLGGVILFHLLLNYLSKHFTAFDKLVNKILLGVVSAILFAALFIEVDIALFGVSENMLREYRGWLPATLITSIVVPIVYHMSAYSKKEETAG